MTLEKFSRLHFAHLPTPLEPLTRLSKALKGPEIWIKRDDCTGLSSGGNKTRKLEFLMAEAQTQGAEVIITAGALQSNHARQTAAAAARCGLKCLLILENGLQSKNPLYLQNDNVLLDRLFNAKIQEVTAGTDMDAALSEAVADFAKNGVKAYSIPIGGSNPIGALGYVDCAQELSSQAQSMDLTFDALVMGTGSAGTQAGLVAGFKQTGLNLPVHGMCVSALRHDQEEKVRKLTVETLELIGVDAHLNDDDIKANSDYVGEGYAIPAASTLEAIRMTAETEGLLLDPVYTGKAMAGLIDYARKGLFRKSDNVVFLHTGGSAALFAYENSF